MSAFRSYRLAPLFHRLCSRVARARRTLCVRYQIQFSLPAINSVTGVVVLGLSTTLGLSTISSPAHAQVTTITHDVSLHFMTPDLSPKGGLMQSIWAADQKDGIAINYNLTTGWNTKLQTFGSFTNIKTPDVDMGLFTIPGIDFGEWGGGGKVFTKGTDTGLVFGVRATGGSVDVDYPMHVHFDTPKYVAPGSDFIVHVTYIADSAARVSTFSPQASASVNVQGNMQLYLNGRVEIASKDLFNTDLIDLCDRTDVDSPFYSPTANVRDNKGIHFNAELLNTNLLVSGAVGQAVANYPSSLNPWLQAQLNFPSINTVGQPGSVAHYNNESGGSTGRVGGNYEYTQGLTIPDPVQNNPNATYARGSDNVMIVRGDFTNFITDMLDHAGIPMPPLNYNIDAKAAVLQAGIIDLQADFGLGLLQEFAFVPRPTVTLEIPGGGTTMAYEIDPIKGVDIPVHMPSLPPGADPKTSVSVQLKPHITLNNDFTSNTYLNYNGGLTFRPIYLALTNKWDTAGARVGSFNLTPIQLSVTANLPRPIYRTTFEIPFDSQDGDSFYVKSQLPPLATLASLDPNVVYVNERDTTNTGLSHLGTWLSADPTVQPGNDFAAPLYGNIGSGIGMLHYSTIAYWDKVVEDNRLFWDGVRWADPNHTYSFSEYAAFFYSATNSRPDSTPGIHHIYAANSATTPSSNSLFGPLISSLPIRIAYPAPVLDQLGVLATDPSNPANRTDPFDPGHLLYRPFTGRYTGPNGSPAVDGAYAGSDGFTLLALDNTPFSAPDYTPDPALPMPFAVGSFSRIKLDGKLLAPDPASSYNNKGRPWVSGVIPKSMIARAGFHSVQITNPDAAGGGGDSNTIYMLVRNPVPLISSVSALLKNPIDGANTDIASQTIVAGSPDTRIKIVGSSLVPDTQVYWNNTATPLATEFVDNHLMYAILPAALLTQPQRNHTVIVRNPVTISGTLPDGGSANWSALNVIAATPNISGVQVNGAEVNALTLNTPTDTTLTIKGQHFWPGLSIVWAGQSMPSTFVDEQTMQVVLPAKYMKTLGPNFIDMKGQDYTGNTVNSNRYAMQVVYGKPMLATGNNLPIVNPPAIQVGAGSTTVTIAGGLFYPSSQVKINGIACPTTFLDNMHLKATVPAAVSGVAGSYPVVVTNPTSGTDNDGNPINDGGTSNVAPFVVQKYAPLAQLSTAVSLTRVGTNVIANITLTNTGAADAAAISVSSALLGTTKPGDALPVSIGTLGIGQSKVVKFTFPIPVSQQGVTTTLKLSGTMSGTSFGTSNRVAIP